MRGREIGLAVLPPALWGVAYSIAKPAMDNFPPLFLGAIAYAVTAICLFRPFGERRTPLWAVVAAATLGAGIQSALIFNGIAMVPATTAVLVVQSQVPFAVLAAWAIGQERMNGRRIFGIVTALAGVALVVGMPEAVGEIRGLVLIVLGTLSWGIAQAIIRAKSRDPGGMMMGMMSLIAAPELLVLSLFMETGQARSLLTARPLDWVAVAIFALGGFVAAYTIWYSLLRRHRVDQIAPFILLMPIFGVLTASIVLKERPTPWVLVGGLVIMVGLLLVVRAPKDRIQAGIANP